MALPANALTTQIVLSDSSVKPVYIITHTFDWRTGNILLQWVEIVQNGQQWVRNPAKPTDQVAILETGNSASIAFDQSAQGSQLTQIATFLIGYYNALLTAAATAATISV